MFETSEQIGRDQGTLKIRACIAKVEQADQLVNQATSLAALELE